MKVLFVASEVNPIAKVGGLADVAGALPKEIKKQGVDIEIVLPFYDVIDIKQYDIIRILPEVYFEYDGKKHRIAVHKVALPNSDVTVYLIRNKEFISSGGIYLSKSAFCDSKDEIERFRFFSAAVWHLFERGFFNHDVIHCQDWHTGYLTQIAQKPTLFTIHNIANQGKIGRGPNYMQMGIQNATIINTVSSTYAKEIQTPEFGEKLDNDVRKRKNDVYGILNGIDYDFFNPKTDQNIFKKYNLISVANKVVNKVKIEEEIGLCPSEFKIMLGLVSRLTSQKAIDMVEMVVAEILYERNDVYFVGLGIGDERLEKRLRRLEKRFPEKARVINVFDPVLAQKIYAGSDIFLMPSNFEPCGLCQMIAMRYGTVPVVRKTGGLADSVIDEEDGFVFKRKNPVEFRNAVKRAIKASHNEILWGKIVGNAMTKDFRWKNSAKEYIKLYKRAYEKYEGVRAD